MSRPIATRARVVGTPAGDFVVIEHSSGKTCVLLDEDKTLQRSLIDDAAELRGRARQLLRQANLIDQARALL
jgi:hypothetical protein